MKTNQHVVAYVWRETLSHESLTEPTISQDSIQEAKHRATLMFDLLLTYLSGPSATQLPV